MKSINPATGKTIKDYKPMSNKESAAIVADAEIAFLGWRKTDFSARRILMLQAAKMLRENSIKYAELMTGEMGKPCTEAAAEIEKCAWVCEYYAEHAESFLKDELIETDASKSYISFQPLGVVLAVMPWNFPFWQVLRFAAPALMAGNAAVLKHASNVCGCALAIEEVFRNVGFPENLFRTLLIGSDQVSEIIAHENIKAVTLTGSVGAGRAVAQEAGKNLKKTVLELGGSDPYIVLKDADLDQASEICVKSRMINGGQSCIAAKRFIVEESIHDEFVKKVCERMQSIKFGDPKNAQTKLGPMASVELRNELHKQVEASVKAGAECLLGGQIPVEPGAFYPATVLSNVTPKMPAYAEELFGPVAVIIKAKDEEDAISIANDSVFGLGAAIFTRDKKKAEKIARERIESGSCFINSFVKSDPRLPFGGIKESGYGRELSHFGIREFVNIKTVSIA